LKSIRKKINEMAARNIKRKMADGTLPGEDKSIKSMIIVNSSVG
jgi:hypothetical protein